MAKSIRSLSGAAKDVYIKRVLAAEKDIDSAARARLTARLQDEIALVSLRPRRRHTSKRTSGHARSAVSTLEIIERETPGEPARDDAQDVLVSAEPAPEFDPYSPNVIVVFRTRGREAALAELHSIEDVDSLRLLAREQQLGIASDLESAADIRHAIVAAAERRVANRRAAAS